MSLISLCISISVAVAGVIGILNANSFDMLITSSLLLLVAWEYVSLRIFAFSLVKNAFERVGDVRGIIISTYISDRISEITWAVIFMTYAVWYMIKFRDEYMLFGVGVGLILLHGSTLIRVIRSIIDVRNSVDDFLGEVENHDKS